MKRDTKEKLKRLSLLLTNKYSSDILTPQNIIKLGMIESKSLGLNLHTLTIRRHIDWIVNYISRIRYNTFFPQSEVVVKSKLDELFTELTQLDDINEVKITLVNGEVKSWIKPQPKIWSGLFEYREDGGVYFRTGNYKGCNVMSSQSLREYFKNYLDLYAYVTWCLSPRVLNSISETRNNEELEMNIKTLTELKEKIEMRSQFPTVLKQIRRKKGLES